MFKEEAWLIGATIFIVAFCVGVLGLSGSWAQAAPVPYNEPYDSDPYSARDSETFQSDLSLTNACIESDGSKAECLCVTRVLKYEMTLQDYVIAAQLYSHRPSTTQNDGKARLIKAGHQSQDLETVTQRISQLTRASNFQKRCQEAASYFANTGQ